MNQNFEFVIHSGKHDKEMIKNGDLALTWKTFSHFLPLRKEEEIYIVHFEGKATYLPPWMLQ